jgi:hypothetical protein
LIQVTTFRLQQGNLATTNLANQAGGLIGGNALQGLTNYGQGAASTEFQNAFNRFQTQRGNIYNTLAGIAGIGQTAQKQTSDLAQNVAGNIGQATIGIGNAYAGGQIGAANALSGGIPRRWQFIYVGQFVKTATIRNSNACGIWNACSTRQYSVRRSIRIKNGRFFS